MASSKQLILLAIMGLSFPSIFAIDYVVGDGLGWTTNFDYKKWAQGKEFRVGDKLIFNYPKGLHDVIKIPDTASFQQCMAPVDAETLTSGSDMITLAKPGKKWYICGFGKHCEVGMSLECHVVSKSLNWVRGYK